MRFWPLNNRDWPFKRYFVKIGREIKQIDRPITPFLKAAASKTMVDNVSTNKPADPIAKKAVNEELKDKVMIPYFFTLTKQAGNGCVQKRLQLRSAITVSQNKTSCTLHRLSAFPKLRKTKLFYIFIPIQ